MIYQNHGLVNNPVLSLRATNDNVHAELSLFSRAYTPDFARRPLVYSFNGAFREELNDRLSRIGDLGGFKPQDAYFGKCNCASNLILPNVRAEAVNMSSFNESWTFILIITTVRNSTPYTGMPSSIIQKEIFSGYVADTPISNSGLVLGTQNDPYNHNALLVTTHHTEFDTSDNRIQPVSVTADADIIPQQIAANIQKDGTALASLRPDLLLNGITPDDGIYSSSIMTSPVPLNQNAKEAENIPVDFNMPTAHTTKLVSSLANSIRNTNFSGVCGYGDALAELTSNYSAQLQPGYCVPGALYRWSDIINPGRSFTIGDLINAFPGRSLCINNYEQPFGQQVDIVDTMAPTVQNQMSSLISMCIPPMLVECGLSDISVSYRSFDPSCDGMHKGSYNWSEANPLVPLSPEHLRGKLEAFMDMLIQDVFMIVYANAGEFMVNITSSVCGTTLVDLHLMDWESTNQNGFSLTNNRLGGLNSSMIGSTEISNNNQIQLSGILQDCVNTAKVNEQFIPSTY